jgi:uncharacterized protein YjbJ (UPF0337 family)
MDCAGTGARSLRWVNNPEEVLVDKEHVKGAVDKAKGVVKDTAGKIMGDDKLRAEGKFDKLKGESRKVAGDVKDAARDAAKDD